MSDKLKLCKACDDSFTWDQDVIVVDDEIYHKDCVTLYPTGYVAFIGDQPLGETENDDGSMAYDFLNEDQLMEESE